MNREKHLDILENLAESHFKKRIRFIHDKSILYLSSCVAAFIMIPAMFWAISTGHYLLGFSLLLLVVIAGALTEVADKRPGKYLSGSWELRFRSALRDYQPINQPRHLQLLDNIRVVGMQPNMIYNWISFERYDTSRLKNEENLERIRPSEESHSFNLFSKY